MGKGYKGRTCVYCAVENCSNTEDHVLARQFFPEARRANLPKVPACTLCNGNKSKLEHYLATVLPFAGRHADAKLVLDSMVPRRLAKNQKLKFELSASMGQAWLKRGAMLQPANTLRLDANQLESLIRYIVRGLTSYHWNIVVPANYAVGVGIWTAEGERLVTSVLPTGGRSIVEESWGEGAFEYRGVRAVDDPNLTMWRFKLYGGALLSGDANLNSEASPRIWAITSSKEIPELFRY